MSENIHNREEVPTGDDVDQGQVASNPAPHIVPNNPKVRHQVTPTNSVGSQATPVMAEDPNNPMYFQASIIELM